MNELNPTTDSFKSLYYKLNENVTAAQFIAELVLRNKSYQLNEPLPSGFYRIEFWRIYFQIQLRTIYKLLEEYHSDIIIKLVRDANIYNISAKWVRNELDRITHSTLAQTKQINHIVNNPDYAPPVRIANSTGRQNKDIDFSHFDI